MKKIVLLLSLIALSFTLQAQTLVTIQDIQTVSSTTLATCYDTSMYNTQYVKVRGTVVMNGGMAQSANGRQVWIQSGLGDFSGVNIRFGTNSPTSPTDMLDLIAGDSVEIVGYVSEFQGETQVTPDATGVSVIGTGSVMGPELVTDVSLLNDQNRINNIVQGEAYEGKFIELQNVTVVSVDNFATSPCPRYSFVVQDANGNKINVSDRFMAGRVPACGGTFVVPNVGDIYTSIQGVLLHPKNGTCPDITWSSASQRGYELHPFDASHYVINSASPSITNIMRNHITPTSAQAIDVMADIVDPDGSITSAYLNYAVGVSTTVYTQVAMTLVSGNTYTATIPAQANTSFVKYYITATDDSSNTVSQPDVPSSNQNPIFFIVRDNGTEIYDIQYTPYGDGNSGYMNMDVTVTGVVTASSFDLGYVYIQQENLTSWAGVFCLGSGLAPLQIGQKVTVTGTVKESFGMTRLENITTASVIGNGTINAISLQPNTFTMYDFATNEQYEAMLVSLYKTNGMVSVVNQNCDAVSPNTTPNFGEYRLGYDVFDPNTGCRVLAGRQTSSTFSSLNVSYVNDSIWSYTDGIMNVPAMVVTVGQSWDTVRGIMYYGFSNMKLLPRDNSDFILVTGMEHSLTANAYTTTYPNPVQNNLWVSFNAQASAGTLSLELYDLTGRMVKSTELGSGEGVVAVNVENIATGTYFCKIVTENKELVSQNKIVIVR